MDYFKDVPGLQEAKSPKMGVMVALYEARDKTNKLLKSVDKKLADKIWNTIGELVVDVDNTLKESADKKFMKSFETHNGKFKVTMYRMGPGFGKGFEWDLRDNKSNKTKTEKFDTEREMKNAWQKIHKENLK